MNSTTPIDQKDDSKAAPEPRCAAGPARQYHARLVMRAGARYCALTEDGAIWVTAAAGCLLQPTVDDIALVSIVGAGGYILSILERGRPDRTAVMSLQGTLRLETGKLEVATPEGLSLDAGSSLHINTDAARFELGTAQVRCQTLGMEGANLLTRWDRRTDISGERTDIASYSEARFGQSTRRIAGHEEITAASFRQAVTRDWTVRAGTTTLVGRDRAMIDGDSIQIG
jgi:hypothetical protein